MIETYRFHGSYPEMPDLFHSKCEYHPEWKPCLDDNKMRIEIAHHLHIEHPELSVAYNIVNQLGDLWNVPVDVRQATNDEADEFVAGLLRRFKENG